MVNHVEVLKMIRHLSSGLPIDATPNMMRHLFEAIAEISSEAISKTPVVNPPRPEEKVAVQVTTDGLRVAPRAVFETKPQVVLKEPPAVGNNATNVMAGYKGPAKEREAIAKILTNENVTFAEVYNYGRKNNVHAARVKIVRHLLNRNYSHRKTASIINRGPSAIGLMISRDNQKKSN